MVGVAQGQAGWPRLQGVLAPTPQQPLAVTPANVNDGRAEPPVLTDDPGAVFADGAYGGPPSVPEKPENLGPHANPHTGPSRVVVGPHAAFKG